MFAFAVPVEWRGGEEARAAAAAAVRIVIVCAVWLCSVCVCLIMVLWKNRGMQTVDWHLEGENGNEIYMAHKRTRL